MRVGQALRVERAPGCIREVAGHGGGARVPPARGWAGEECENQDSDRATAVGVGADRVGWAA